MAIMLVAISSFMDQQISVEVIQFISWLNNWLAV